MHTRVIAENVGILFMVHGVYVHTVEDSTLTSTFDQFRFFRFSGVAKNRP